MFKINDAHARSDAEKIKQDTEKKSSSRMIGTFSWKYLLDIGIVLAMAVILF